MTVLTPTRGWRWWKRRHSGEPSLANPMFAAMDTTFTNDLSADGFSWANARVLAEDQYGNLIALCQRYNSSTGQNNFVYSNDGGATRTDAGLTEGFIERGCAALDRTNGVLHVLWKAVDPTDGMIYRRYTLGYTSTAISSITKDAGVNLQMDFQNAGTMSYAHPLLLHINDGGSDGTYGKLLAVWGARNAGVGNEIRASMCVLGAVADRGKTAGNWAAPVTADTTGITQSPAVAYTKVVANTNGAIPYPSIGRKTLGTNANDIYCAYHDGGNASAGAWRFRRLRWASGSNNWSTGLSTATLITAVQRAGTDTGYNLKAQLGSFVVEDTLNNRMAFGLATWKSNVLGDTWGYALIDSADGVTLVDSYSANGAHSYAPTGDVAYDAVTDRIAVSYIKTSTSFAYVQLYDGSVAAGDEVPAYSDDPVDIPLLYPRYQDTLLMLFRVQGSPPQAGVFGALDWS